MPIMYVDDSGSPRYTDHTKYFILSGIIVDDNKINDLRQAVFDYQQTNFVGEMIDSEIHTHEIYKSKTGFRSIDLATKIRLLDKLYEMIGNINCTGILVVINKERLQAKSKWTPFEKAWVSLLEAYNMFLNENSYELGKLKVDKNSSKIQNAISGITHRLNRYHESNRQKFNIAQPIFLDSSGTYGIQIADAVAYCTLKHKMKDVRFGKYWKIIHQMLWRNNSGVLQGYGYNEQPK